MARANKKLHKLRSKKSNNKTLKLISSNHIILKKIKNEFNREFN